MSDPAEKLRRARQAKGYATAADAARAYGWKEATYTSHENGTRGIRPDAAKRYEKALGVPATELLSIGKPAQHDVSNVYITASAEVGLWRDMSLDDNMTASQHRTILVPSIVGGGPMSPKFAVAVRDASVNKVIQIGEYVICEHIDPKQLADIDDGAFVFVERKRGTLVEQSIRRIQRKSAEHIFVMCWSTEKRFSEIIDLNQARKAGEEIAIVGRVVGRYAPL